MVSVIFSFPFIPFLLEEYSFLKELLPHCKLIAPSPIGYSLKIQSNNRNAWDESFPRQCLARHKITGFSNWSQMVGNTAWKLHNQHFEGKRGKTLKWMVVCSIGSWRLIKIITECFEISNLLSNFLHISQKRLCI